MSVVSMCDVICGITTDEKEVLTKSRARRLLEGDKSLLDEIPLSDLVPLMSFVNDGRSHAQLLRKRIEAAGKRLYQLRGRQRKFFW